MDGLTYVLTDLHDHLIPTLTRDLWPTPSQLVAIVLCTSVVYLFLVFFLQFSRRSMLGHSSMLDLVLMLVLANGVQNAMVAGDATLVGGLAAAFTLFAWDGALGYIRRRFPHSRRYLGGERIQLIRDGVVQQAILDREELDTAELDHAAKQQGLKGLDRVCDAFLELDGSVTLIPTAEDAGTPPSQLRPVRRHRRHKKAEG